MGEDLHKLETLIFSLFNSFTRTTKKKKQYDNLLGKKAYTNTY